MSRIDWQRFKDDVYRSPNLDALGDALGLQKDRERFKWSCPVCKASDNLHIQPGRYVKCYTPGCKADPFSVWSVAHGLGEKPRGDDWMRVAQAVGEVVGVDLSVYGYEGASARPSTARPRNRPAPAKPKVCPVVVDPRRAAVFARIWQAVEPLALTPEAKGWLRSRGIRPEVAHLYGVRDWRPAREAIREALREFGAEDYRAAGLIKDDGEWWSGVARYLDGTEWAQGVMFPIWHPGHRAPVAARLRLYRRPEFNEKLKALNQPLASPELPHIPLGLREPPPAFQRLVYGWPHDHPGQWAEDETWTPPHHPSKASAPYSVILCEGETDWLSVASAACDINLPERVVPIGWCEMASPWRDDWLPVLAGARRVVVAFDVGSGRGDDAPAGEQRNKEIAASLVAEVGRARASAAYWSALQREGLDLADLHARNELAPKLRDWLGG